MAESRGAIPERVRRALYTLSRGRCYAPECTDPVIVIDGTEPVFVGEIAHIVGAVESGPRGAAHIANREGFENLLILCGRHHKIIDDPRTSHRYPVEVLYEWKAKHEAEFDTATRAALQEIDSPQYRLPDLLVIAFRDATAQLELTVERLEAAGEVTHDIARLLHAALARPDSGPSVGDGAPGAKESFEEAYDAAGGASYLGLPSGEVFSAGPGLVQHLRGARCGHPSVICAIPGRPAVVVASAVWNAIGGVGGGFPGTGLHGVGFPAYTTDDARYVGPASDLIRTEGGSWGRGELRRIGDEKWKWVADLAFDPNIAGNAETGVDSQARLDLRLRLAAQIPLTLNEPRLTAAGRRRLTAELAKPGATAMITELAADRVEVPNELIWRPRTDQNARNDSWGASYECTVDAADGKPAVRGRLQMIMPNLMTTYVTCLIDVEVDFDRCQTVPCKPNTPVSRRLSHREIADFFVGAWQVAFDVAPLALYNQSGDIDPGDRPRADFYVINERPENRGDDRTFRFGDLFDMDAFGITTKSYLYRLAIGVVGRSSLPEHEARDVVQRALIRATEDAGYDGADLVRW